MKIVDANVLLYAVNADAPHHGACRRWLEDGTRCADAVGFTWVVLLAFLRISTKVGLFPRPLTVDEATRQVGAWLAAPGSHQLTPGRGHLALLERLLGDVGSGGNLVNDAHVAALALEHRADVVTYDTDFGRFPGVTWLRPDDLVDP